MKKHILNKAKRICNITLVVFLILGIFASVAGTCVVAFTKSHIYNKTVTTQNEQPSQSGEIELVSPVDEYEELPNEIKLNDDVITMNDEDSEAFHDSLVGVDTEGRYGGRMTFSLSGENHSSVDELLSGDYVYIQGDTDSFISADRIFKIESIYNSDGNTIVEVTEPYFEDVYESMEVSFSDLLTKSNFVEAYYAEGVTSYFGNVDSEFETIAMTPYSSGTFTNLSNNSSKTSYASTLTPTVDRITASENLQLTNLATDYSSQEKDLIVEIDYDFSKNAKDKDEDSLVDKSYGIKGSFGIKNLAAHMVSDIPSITDPKELYLGVSGELFVDITPYGKISSSAEMDANKKDLLFATLEGISEKRFPIAVFHFKGTTPIYITNSSFEAQKEKLLSSIYLILYADWKGEISLELSGGFEYTNAFNSGLRVIDDGEFCFKLENYPYYDNTGNETKDGIDWNIDLKLDADTELTLFGSSVLFYVGGVNIGEISIARLGAEAQCEVHLKASSLEGLKLLDSDDAEFYIRGFLKFIEARVKLKANGKGILTKLSVDVDFEFALLDVTLFEKGHKPDKFKPKIPVSTIPAPDEFESIITLVSDVSGSMYNRIATNQTKLEASKEAASTIIDITENWSEKYDGNYGIGIIQFSDYAETISLPHIDYRFLRDCIDSMEDGGGTNIYQGIDAGVSQLTTTKATSKVIILMTDGQDSYDSQALESAKKAADAGIEIYTIGFGEDVDEEILKQIAEATGGEYRYASTDNLIGIMGSFIYAQQSANSDVLAEYEGAVSEGETSKTTTFKIDSMEGDLIATTVWPGSFLDTIVTDPNGRVVDENYPGATIDEASIPSTLTVKNPIKGHWSFKVKGVETSYDKEPFYTVVSFKEIKNENSPKELSYIESLSVHCIPIGIYVALVSLLLLLCINKKKKSEKA